MHFDKITDRTNCRSLKWDAMERAFGVPANEGLPMWIADKDFEAPEFLTNAMQELVDKENYGYFSGHEKCLEAVQWWMETRHDWKVEQDWMFTTYGLGHGIATTLLALTEPGDAEADHHDEVQHRRGQVTGERARNPVIQSRPTAHLSRVALSIERGRKTQKMPQEAARQSCGRGNAYTAQEGLAQREQDTFQDDRGSHGQQDRAQPILTRLADHLIDEDLRERRDREPRDDHQHTGQQAQQQRTPGPPDGVQKCPPNRRSATTTLERSPGCHREDDSGEAGIELLVGHDTMAAGRIVQEHAIAAEPLDDEKVIEVPERDIRHRDVAEPFDLVTEPVRLETMMSGRDHDVRCATAVSRDSAITPEISQRNVLAEMRQHDSEAGCAALHRLHLQEERCLLASREADELASRRHSDPNQRRRTGMTKVMGARRSMVTRTSAVIPDDRGTGGVAPPVQSGTPDDERESSALISI